MDEKYNGLNEENQEGTKKNEKKNESRQGIPVSDGTGVSGVPADSEESPKQSVPVPEEDAKEIELSVEDAEDALPMEEEDPVLSAEDAEDTEPELSLEDGEELEEDEFFDSLEEEQELTDEEKAARRKKRKKIAAIVCGSVLGAVVIVYLGFAVFFMSHFYFNTEINGVQFSASTVSDVESYMENQVQNYELTLLESDGGTEVIDGSDISLSYEEGEELEALLRSQNPLLWICCLWETPEITASVGVSYDEDRLTELINSLECMKPENQTAPENARPEFDGNEFVVKAEVTGKTIDTEVFPEKVREALDGFQDTLDMTEEGCYVKPKYTEESQEVADACTAMNQYLRASITYTFGSATEVVDKNLISQWLTVDDNMAVTFNTDAVSQYIQELANKYNTYQAQRTFTSGSGNTVSVEGGDYGWIIDKDAEYQALTASIQNGEVITKEPAYSQTAATHDGPDWGNTYVEVDLTNQYMYLFVNGAVVTSGPIVTGKPSAGDATPQGVYSIKYCQRNAVLRGPLQSDGTYEWESPVSFWMPFNGGIGLHDAPWQAAFGGDRYLTHGSHGCVNLQYAVAETTFNNVQAGTPVVCHY